MAGRKPILDPELVAAKLVELSGNISGTARAFHVSRTAVQQLIKKRASLQEVLSDSREGMLDNVESALYKAALAGEAWAVCFFLKTQGKSRGYIERQEVTGKDGESLANKNDHNIFVTSDDLDEARRFLERGGLGNLHPNGGQEPVDTASAASTPAAIPPADLQS